LVPVKNGVIPEPPEGEHSSQSGTLLAGAVVPVADDPPDAARVEDVVPALPTVVDRVLAADPVADEAPDSELADPAPIPVAVAEFDSVAVPEVVVVAGVVGKLRAPYGFARLVPATPRVVTVVCAPAGKVSAIESNSAMQNSLAIKLAAPPTVSSEGAALLGSRTG
jgi:hypothetical protein